RFSTASTRFMVTATFSVQHSFRTISVWVVHAIRNSSNVPHASPQSKQRQLVSTGHSRPVSQFRVTNVGVEPTKALAKIRSLREHSVKRQYAGIRAMISAIRSASSLVQNTSSAMEARSTAPAEKLETIYKYSTAVTLY